jgi:ketosteroid isomerase-like protein
MEPKRLIETYFQAWLTQDNTRLAEFFEPNAVYRECYGPEYHGLTQIVRWFQDWNKRGRVTRWDILGSVQQGNTQAVEWTFGCTYDGAESLFDGVSLVEFSENGKIQSLKEFQSKAEHVFPYGED